MNSLTAALSIDVGTLLLIGGVLALVSLTALLLLAASDGRRDRNEDPR